MTLKPQKSDLPLKRQALRWPVAAFLGAALLLGAGAPAAAQRSDIATRGPSATPFTTTPAATMLKVHETTVLATYYEIDPATCKAMAEPLVAITQQPGVAELYLAHIDRLEHGSRFCNPMRVPAVQVMLHAGGVPGMGRYAWEVRFQQHRAPVVAQGEVGVDAAP